MVDELRVSVIIPVRNGAAKIERCLEAIQFQSLKPSEVILVDGHSDDGTVEKAGKFPVRILYEDYRTRSGACQQVQKMQPGSLSPLPMLTVYLTATGWPTW